VEPPLSPLEVRILGCLLEKQVTTPEYYPLTLNSLVSACNQTTNRDPVTAHDESAVERALEGLRDKGLIWVVRGGRALKYEHRLGEKLKLAPRETAALCVMMLRGPQTVGEIRGRTGRLYSYPNLEEVDAALETLMKAEPPLATRLPRLPGTKESRFAHLLGGEVAAQASEPPAREGAAPAPVTTPAEGEKIARLEAEVAALRAEIEELRRQFLEIKSRPE
jgi:hypothetical protein